MSTYEYDDTTADAERASEAADPDRLELAAQVELLREENRRLRAEYARARRATYRRTALGLAAVGLVAVAGGALFPPAREVLVTLGAIGLFGAVLTYFLTPERFVAADVGERVYAACAGNLAAVAAALGLREARYYLPTDGAAAARLFVPLAPEPAFPTEGGPILLEEDRRGLLLEPTGAALFREFERALAGELAPEPAALAAQLCDGLVEGFELARAATPEVDPDGGRVTVAVSGSAFGDVDRFDHPIPSLLATGLAAGLDRPVTVAVDPGDERADWLVTCRFEADA